MPFGRPGHGEFGTYFIGYSRSPRTIEQMLENMFIGRPPGNYDRLLDFSRAVTGNLFFVPSATFLENLNEDQAIEDQTIEDQAIEDTTAAAESPAAPAVNEVAPSSSSSSIPSVREGSLGIGSLKGDTRHE
jgi:putative iron-dependent peroxidase